MDWKSVAIEKLKDYEVKRQALENIPLEIAQVESNMTSIRSACPDCAPVSGGSSDREGKLLNCIVQRDELQRILERAKQWVRIVDRGLSVLDPEEQKVLNRFYICGGRSAAEDLAAEYFVDAKTIYRWRDKALRKFTIALYGVTES